MFFLSLSLFLDTESQSYVSSVTQAGVQWQHNLSSLQPLPPGFKRFSCSDTQVAGSTGVRHQAQLHFVFLVEKWFHHVDQAGLELLTSSDPPALTSQIAGITGVSHHTWPYLSSHCPYANYIILHSIVSCFFKIILSSVKKWKGFTTLHQIAASKLNYFPMIGHLDYS